MKTCEEYRELFDAYIARELNRMERMELEAHVDQCSECAKLLSEQEILFGEELYTMPESVSKSVMEKVNASMVGDLFTTEEDRESIEMAVRRKMRKRDGIKSFVIVAVVVLFAVGYYFLEDYMLGKNEALRDDKGMLEESTEETVIENESVSGGNGVNLSESDLLTNLRTALVSADNLTVKFGASNVIIYEKFEIEYLTDYIVSCPVTPIEGRVTYKSIGSIKSQPDSGMNIQITDNHRIILTVGSQIYEIQTEREDLLYAFEGVGILS